MAAPIRLRLRLPADMAVDDMLNFLCADGSAFTFLCADGSAFTANDATAVEVGPLFADIGTVVEIGLLVVNAPIGAKYLLDLLGMLRERHQSSSEIELADAENALIVDGARYDLTHADAESLRGLLD